MSMNIFLFLIFAPTFLAEMRHYLSYTKVNTIQYNVAGKPHEMQILSYILGSLGIIDYQLRIESHP